MLIKHLASIIDRSGCVETFWGKLDDGIDAALGLVSSARPFFIAARFAHDPQPTLVVTAGEEPAHVFARTLASYVGESNVYEFPELKDRPHLEEKPDPESVSKRFEAAWLLKQGVDCIVVASARSLLRSMPPSDSGVIEPIRLVAGQELIDMPESTFTDIEELRSALERTGFVNTGELDGPGTFAQRGGTFDIFPGTTGYPVRLDFFGDELEEIRRIVTSTGQTISSLESIDIFPVSNIPMGEKDIAEATRSIKQVALTNKTLRDAKEKLDGGLRFDGSDILMPYIYSSVASLSEYLNKSSMLAIIEPRAVFDDMMHAYEEIEPTFKGTYLNPDGLYLQPATINFNTGVQASYVSIMQSGIVVDDEVPIKRVDVSRSPDRLYERLHTWVEGSYYILFSLPHARARTDMELELVDKGLPIIERLDSLENDNDTLKRGVVSIVDVDIPLGIVVPSAKLTLLSLEDLKGSRGSGRSRRTVNVTDITFPYTAGDYVVHEIYGIALFKGLVLRELDGAQKDYLELDYAEGDKLFLPVDQFDKVTRYVGPEGSTPHITRLNSTDWSRAIKRARKASRKLAFDLIEVYSRRAATKGYSFEVDSPFIREMEDSFPYTETPDQAAAIADVKADMHSEHPMDRLICGDVGFGKTEIAIRAAFIAAQNGKQVMVLCPTTILTQQHAINFKERMEPFGIRVEALSRFRSAAEQKSVLEDFAAGKVGVLLGTHRLLSRDVNPQNLGLLIIDEEQRFGVQHKEQFKNLREYIDILTLSATPIPRTMQMAVSGVRDMSLILTPPADRLPVKVHVGEWDPDIVSGAIRNELSRGGQVYYVSNRVNTIDEAVDRVKEAAPEARIGVAHGKMSKEALEHVMEDFSAGLIDVLVATTIIESGIDNPMTNTLIIEDSQRLGLSQMYQLKGRVGRSDIQAFAYFMFPEEIPLTEDAQARLEALSELQDLGSGMRIAMKDLEIRGAGNLLGAEQSGNMSAVGFDLFSQMLNQAIQETREGESVVKKDPGITSSDININIPGHMYLPNDYIDDLSERVLWYRRLANAMSESEIDDLEKDMLAIYPEMPQAAKNLFNKERLRTFALEHGIKSISISGGNLTVEGIVLNRDQLIPLKRHGTRYLSDKRKMIVPLNKIRAVELEDNSETASSIVDFLHGIFGQED